MANGQQGGGVNVPAQTIINALHERYTKSIAMLMQENAELSAVVDAQGQELDEYRSRELARGNVQPVGAGGLLGEAPLLGSAFDPFGRSSGETGEGPG